MKLPDDIITLENYEDEEVFDVVEKLEKSFDLRFDKYAFCNVETFGDLCAVFEAHINYEQGEGCTSQQAFYRVRDAISSVQYVQKNEIGLNSSLTELFPRHNRWRKIKEFQQRVGARVDMLTYPSWMGTVLVSSFILSVLAFFIDWRIAVSGIAFFILVFNMAERLGKTLKLLTVQQLTETLTAYHYISARRNKTINRQEISKTIVDAFHRDLAIDKIYLTPEARFSWTTIA